MQEINQSGGYSDEIEGKLKGILDSFNNPILVSLAACSGAGRKTEEKLMAGAKRYVVRSQASEHAKDH